MDGLEAEFSGRVHFARLNVDEPEQARIQQSYGMRGHPSVVILDANGEPTQRYFGAEEAETLRAALSAVAP